MISPLLLRELESILGAGGVVTTIEGRITYECDMLTYHRGVPDAVCLPTSVDQVVAIVRLAAREGVPIIARGSGTGLSGGVTAPRGGIVLATTRMNRLIEVDHRNRCAVVEPGLVNVVLSRTIRSRAYYFAPDPSSQIVSSIGGNAATNAGGIHCLKYGVTANHVLGLEMVTAEGNVVLLGGRSADSPSAPLVRLAIGSEGTLGVITKLIVRILHLPETVETHLAAFQTIDEACETVSEIMAAGILPAALELIDDNVVRLLSDRVRFPDGAGAVLLAELDGPRAEVSSSGAKLLEICKRRKPLVLETARTEEQRQALWKGRKEAAGALARLTRAWLLQDVVVPRSKLAEMVRRIGRIAAARRVTIATLAHAGDGNLHPVVCYDDRDPKQLEIAREAAHEIILACLELGGSVSGEHGIGVDKLDAIEMQYDAGAIAMMLEIRKAFDPNGIMNPGKLLPSHPACSERMHLPEGAWV